jgi:sigma-B regulation protein RsbU (phosphoserine phosphatase)
VQTRSNELEKANEIVLQHSDLLEQELQTAHEMQMRLMPQSNPEVIGYEVEGLCRPATQVGGDFFQYFSVGQDKWVFALADVTGHGMQAAIPTMVFSGLLDTEISYSPAPETLMPKLNASLCRVLEPRTFVCLSLGELDSANNTMRISNGGCPYPYIYRSAEDSIEEVALSAFPLGVRESSSYDVSEVTLSEGDVVVFCSDGIVEAMSESGEPFGFERLAHLILQAGSKSESAECIIDNLFKELDAFSIGHEQDDDQTVVVVRAQGRLAAT